VGVTPRADRALALPSDLCRMRLIIPMIIQTMSLDPSGAVWTDGASNVSRLEPSGAVQVDAEHPTRHRKVVGANPTSDSKITGQSTCTVAPVGVLSVNC
jgi:hypothetical protein